MDPAQAALRAASRWRSLHRPHRARARQGYPDTKTSTRIQPAIEVVKADPSDNVYLATALAGGARWVVTGNTRPPLDGYAGLRVVQPAVFLAELGLAPIALSNVAALSTALRAHSGPNPAR
jgi:hypothetical protein